MSRLRLAKDVMVTKLITVSPDGDIFDGVRLLLRYGITGAPVVAADLTFLGMLSERCCMRVLTLTAGGTRTKHAGPSLPASRFMATDIVTLRPEMDSLEAVALLLRNRFSGAPVVDAAGNFLGVFSERYSMQLLVHAAYESVPSTAVGAFMNTDRGRLIAEDTDLLTVAQTFLDTYYRRLPVLRGDRLVGQVSHRDVLRTEHHLARNFAEREQVLRHHGKELLRPGAAEREGWPLTIADFMESEVQTIGLDTDFLTIAQIFLHSNRRRLPVLESGKLVGQISRRDLLAAVLEDLGVEPRPERAVLYLSAVMERNQRPLLNRADYARGGAPRPSPSGSRQEKPAR